MASVPVGDREFQPIWASTARRRLPCFGAISVPNQPVQSAVVGYQSRSCGPPGRQRWPARCPDRSLSDLGVKGWRGGNPLLDLARCRLKIPQKNWASVAPSGHRQLRFSPDKASGIDVDLAPLTLQSVLSARARPTETAAPRLLLRLGWNPKLEGLQTVLREELCTNYTGRTAMSGLIHVGVVLVKLRVRIHAIRHHAFFQR